MHINSIVIQATVTLRKTFIVSLDRVDESPEDFVEKDLPSCITSKGWEIAQVQADEEPYVPDTKED